MLVGRTLNGKESTGNHLSWLLQSHITFSIWMLKSRSRIFSNMCLNFGRPPEFAESLKGGEILSIDTKFFVDMFVDLMYKEDSKDVWELLDEFLLQESFTSLCLCFLIVLDEEELCTFLELLIKLLCPRIEPMSFNDSSYCLEIILSKCSGSYSFNELLLLNAVLSHGRQLLRLLQEEEHEGEKDKFKDILQLALTSSMYPSTFIQLLKECSKSKTLESIKWLGLQSFILHYLLAAERRDPEAWESLFISNGLSFHQSGKFAFLSSNGGESSAGSKRKKKEGHKNKRRNKHYEDDSYDEELIDFNVI